MKTLKVLLQEVVSGIKAWVNSNFAQESNTVHKTGNETVNGSKTFTGESNFNHNNINRNYSFTLGDNSYCISRMQYNDTNNQRWGAINFIHETDNSVNCGFEVRALKDDGQTVLNKAIRLMLNQSNYSSFYPLTNNATDLGTSSHQWNNFYAKTYYYNGTAWGLDKSNVWTQDQTIAAGTNDKCYRVKDTVYELGQEYSNGEHLGGLTICDKNNTIVGLLDIVDRSYGNTEMRIRVQQKFDPDSNNRSTSGTILFNELALGIGASKETYVTLNGSLRAGTNNAYDLGTSSKKWKTLNGVNPGSLSFPSGGTTENVDWYNVAGDILPTGGNATNFTGGANYFTPSKDGWLALAVVSCESIAVWSSLNYGLSVVAPNTNENRQLIIPVVAGKLVEIKVKGTRWYSARLIVPQGNV